MSQAPAQWFTRPARPLLRNTGARRTPLSSVSRRATRPTTRVFTTPATALAETTATPVTPRAASVPATTLILAVPPLLPDNTAPPAPSLPTATSPTPAEPTPAEINPDSVARAATPAHPVGADQNKANQTPAGEGTPASPLPAPGPVVVNTAAPVIDTPHQRSPSPADSDGSAASSDERLARAMDQLVSEATAGDPNGAADRALLHIGSLLAPLLGATGPVEDVERLLRRLSYCAQLLVRPLLPSFVPLLTILFALFPVRR